MIEFDRALAPGPGPIRPFEFPRVERARLDNGLETFIATNGELPLVSVLAVARAGGDVDPAAAPGLAHLVANGLETGTGQLDADDVAWRLERLGAELAAHVDWDAAALRMTVLREKLDPALEIFAEILRRPSFPTDEVRRLRDEQIADILQRRKEPRALAADMAARFIFPEADPFARPLIGTTESVGEISREDALQFHAARYSPAGAALIAVGDIETSVASERLAQRFADWSGGAAELAPRATRGAIERTSLFVVDRPGAVQSEIRIGHVGVERHHPDYFALLVMNTVLGGAFTSRLNMSLRERHGFTYGARSGFGFRRRPGPFIVQAAVATDVTAAAVREAIRELRLLRDRGVAADEVESARNYLAGVLPLELQTNDQIAARLADLFTYDLPSEYFSDYRRRILAVNAAAVDRVAREHLLLDRLAITIVGDAASIRGELEGLGLGPVEVHDVD
ncbi:MAG: M16 family metallopeptidase [Longimicrobiales bacterium]